MTGARSHRGRRLIRFVIVGCAAALLLFALTWLFRAAGAPPFAGSAVAYGIAIVFAYSAQRGWTFGGSHSHSAALPRYLVVQVACALLAGATAHLAVALLDLSAPAMSAVTTMLASAASYLLSSRWVFSDRRAGAGA
ncbi:MAG: GtrA family protein [Rhizobiaceae bacterium]